MSTRTFPAIGGAGGETSVTFAADLFFAIVLGGQDLQRRLNDTATETVTAINGVNDTTLQTVGALTGAPSGG